MGTFVHNENGHIDKYSRLDLLQYASAILGVHLTFCTLEVCDQNDLRLYGVHGVNRFDMDGTKLRGCCLLSNYAEAFRI